MASRISRILAAVAAELGGQQSASATKAAYGTPPALAPAAVLSPTDSAIQAMLSRRSSASDLATSLAQESQARYFATSAFAPGMPFPQEPIDGVDPETGLILPRRYELLVGSNLLGANTPRVPFHELRKIAYGNSLATSCINLRKNKLAGYQWRFTVTDTALEDALDENPGSTTQQVRKKLLKEVQDDIRRLTAWWQEPDRIAGQDWETWVKSSHEEELVSDALAIYPHPTKAGGLHSLEILDGSTIKPLMSQQGTRPTPPFPAYQQILYGLVRGDYRAVVDADDNIVHSSKQVGGTFANPGSYGDVPNTQGDLLYLPEYQRPYTLYGYSATERAMYAIDDFSLRLQWLRSEYKDGSIPTALLKAAASNDPDNDVRWTAEQRQLLEKGLNESLAGAMSARHQFKLLPPGMDALFPAFPGEKYNTELDEYMIRLVAMCYSVLPTELGIIPKGANALGGRGHQEGEAATSERIAELPTQRRYERLVNRISRLYLSMPDTLTFEFFSAEEDDQGGLMDFMGALSKAGVLSLNQMLSKLGYELIPAEWADMPFMSTPTGYQFMPQAFQMAVSPPTPPAIPQLGPGPAADQPALPAAPEDPAKPDDDAPAPADTNANKAVRTELSKFASHATKRAGTDRWRSFNFEYVPAEIGALLNSTAEHGSVEVVKAVLADLGKARARTAGPDPELRADASERIKADYVSVLALAIPHYEEIKSGIAAPYPSGHVLASAALEDYGPDQDAVAKAEAVVLAHRDTDLVVLTNAIAAVHSSAAAQGADVATQEVGGMPTTTGPLISALSPEESANKIDTTTQNRLSTALAKGLSAGATVGVLAASADAILGNSGRAEDIAGYAAFAAYNAAKIDTATANGTKQWWWETDPGLNNCGVCISNQNDSPVPDVSAFSSGPPPLHTKCGCIVYASPVPVP
jgi:hypothetical protein